MRILHLADRLSDRGGAYVHLLGVLSALAARGHTLRLAVGTAEPSVRAACETVRLPGLEARRRLAVELEACVAGFAPDVVHVHTVVNPAALEAVARWPALITVQDHRYFCPARGKWTAAGEICTKPMEPALCRQCFDDDGYFSAILELTQARLRALRALRAIVLSRYMKQELIDAGLSAERVDVIPPFVHGLDARASPAGPACVLFVGRLAEAKGALEAWQAWRRSGVDLPLVFAGTGPLRESLEGKGATVLGWLDRAALSRQLARARALILPSRWQEPFGIAGLEARSFGVPVVAWASGGVPEWCDPETLVPWGDVEGLAESLRRAAESGRRAAPVVGFGREELMDRLEATYRRVASRAGSKVDE